jgi:hypothetical protein
MDNKHLTLSKKRAKEMTLMIWLALLAIGTVSATLVTYPQGQIQFLKDVRRQIRQTDIRLHMDPLGAEISINEAAETVQAQLLHQRPLGVWERLHHLLFHPTLPLTPRVEV